MTLHVIAGSSAAPNFLRVVSFTSTIMCAWICVCMKFVCLMFVRARESLLCCMQHEATRAHTCQHEWGSPSRQRITHEIRARTASMHTPRRIQTKTIQHRRVVPCRHRPCRARRFTHTCTHNHLRPHAHPHSNTYSHTHPHTHAHTPARPRW